MPVGLRPKNHPTGEVQNPLLRVSLPLDVEVAEVSGGTSIIGPSIGTPERHAR